MNFIRLLLPSIIFVFGLNACSTTYKGTLVDARNYLNLNADGQTPAQQFSAFYAMNANLPAGIMMKKGRLVLLTNTSSQLAKYASSTVKAKGNYLSKYNLLNAEQFWVKTEQGWFPVPIR